MVDRSYVSPLLAPSDLFFALNSSLKLEINSPEELTHPRGEQVRKLYLSLMNLCYGRPVSTPLSKVSGKVFKSLGDISEEMKSAMGVYSPLRELMHRVRSTISLELRDLIAPNEDRTRKIMSDLVNFIRYRTDEELLISETDEMREVAEEEAEIESLRERITNLHDEIAANKAKKEDFDIPISAKRQKILELERDRRHMEEEKEALEAEIATLSEEAEENPQTSALRQQSVVVKSRQIELQHLHTSLQAAVSKMRNVQSLHADYLRCKAEIEELQGNVEEKTTKLAEITAEISEIERKVQQEQEGESQSSSELHEIENLLQNEAKTQQKLADSIDALKESHENYLQSIISRQEKLLLAAESVQSRLSSFSPSIST